MTRSPIKAILAAVALAAALVAGTTATTTAFDQHFVDCLGWLISDPETHAANCLPSRIVGPTESPSTSTTGPGGPPTIVTTVSISCTSCF